jgi:hypothetical protein
LPRGKYERVPKHQVLPNKLRSLADEIEEKLKKVEQAEDLLKRLSSLDINREQA